MIDFKTLKPKWRMTCLARMPTSGIVGGVSRTISRGDDFTSLIIDPSYSVSSLLRVLKSNGLDTTDGSLRSLRRRLEEAVHES